MANINQLAEQMDPDIIISCRQYVKYTCKYVLVLSYSQKNHGSHFGILVAIKLSVN